jgi:hypothetical protein
MALFNPFPTTATTRKYTPVMPAVPNAVSPNPLRKKLLAVKLRKGTSSDKLMGSDIDRICRLFISNRKSFFGKAVSKQRNFGRR